jgi:alpha-galactosidase
MDFLMVGYKELKKWKPRQSAAEYRSQFSLFAVLAAPLMFSADIRGTMDYNNPTIDGTNATADIRSIIGNAEVIAVSQDSIGRQGTLVKELNASSVQLYVRELDAGALALAVLNRGSVKVSKLAVDWADLNVPAGRQVTAVRDLWRKGALPLAPGATGVVLDVASHDTRLLRLGTAKL